MNLPRKLELARLAVANITRHDDADQAEFAECTRLLQQYLTDELAAAAARREARKAAQIEALKEKGDGDSH